MSDRKRDKIKVNDLGSAIALSTAIKNGDTTAKALITDTLNQITKRDPELNCFYNGDGRRRDRSSGSNR